MNGWKNEIMNNEKMKVMKQKLFILFALLITTMTASATDVPTYSLTKADGAEAHGTITFKVGGNTVTAAAEGDEVTVIITPAEGYTATAPTGQWYAAVAASRTRGVDMLNAVTFTAVTGQTNQWTFTMERANVEISTTYKKLIQASWIADISALTYTGQALTPTVTVKDGETTLTANTDYTVSYNNNTAAGTATATVTGAGNYSGSQSKNFTINKADITSVTAPTAVANLVYTGQAQTLIAAGSATGGEMQYSLDGETYATTLPTGTTPIKLADHTALSSAVANKIAKGSYTDETYATYLEAYDYAVYINNQNTATAEDLGNALKALNDAIAGLVIKTNTVTIVRRTTINGATYTIDVMRYSLPVGDSRYNVYIAALDGYAYLRTEGSLFTLSDVGDGSGYLTGNINTDIEITMWYENQVDVSRLNNLLDDALTEQGNYTEASWAVYVNALNEAKEFTLSLDTQQSTVLALVKALEEARTALVVNSNETFIKIEPVAGSFNLGSQIGLHVYTSSNIPSLVFTQNGTILVPDVITGEVQTLTTGETVKYWLVFLSADQAGEIIYTASYGAVSGSVTVEVG